MRRSPFHQLIVGFVGMMMILPYVPRPHTGDGHAMHEHCELCHLTYCTRDRCVCGHRHPNGVAGHFRRPVADAHYAPVGSHEKHGHRGHAAADKAHDVTAHHRHVDAQDADAPPRDTAAPPGHSHSIEACGSTQVGIVAPVLDKYVRTAIATLPTIGEDLDLNAAELPLHRQLAGGGIFRPPIQA